MIKDKRVKNIPRHCYRDRYINTNDEMVKFGETKSIIEIGHFT